MKRSCQLNEDFVSAESCLTEKVVCAHWRRQRDSGASPVSLKKTRETCVSVRQEVRRRTGGEHFETEIDRSFGRKCRSAGSEEKSRTILLKASSSSFTRGTSALSEQIRGLNEKRQSHMALPGRVLKFVLILNELLANFAWVAANDAHVAVAVAGVSDVAVRSSMCTCLGSAVALVAGKS